MTGKITLLFVALAVVAVSAKPSKPGKIVGGEEAALNEFPSLVQIKRNGAHYCGGHIYTDEWIVTAAHCATGRPNDYTIVAGEHDVDAEEGSEQTRQVVRINRHPLYDSSSALDFENDIAVMQVLPPFNFNTQVNNDTELADAGFQLPAVATVAGWGLLAEQGDAPSALQKVNVPVVSDAECDAAYGGNAVADSMMCAGEPGKDSCTGDSGGPLLCEDGDNKVVCGLVSWGRGCARQGYPGVYTEVSHFSDWASGAILPEPEDNSTYVEQLEGCGGALVGSSGRIGYKLDGQYGDNERCAWSFRANDRETVRVTLQNPNLAAGDYLTVSTIDYGTGKVDSSVRLDNENSVVLVTGPLVIVTFVSDAAETSDGISFLLQGLGETGVTRLNYAHVHLGDDSGTYHYPANSSQYNNDEISTVLVNTQTASLSLRVDQIDLESSGTCSFDVLNVHNHAATGYTSVQSLCGTNPGQAVTSDGLALLILKTDYSVTRSGYTISWSG